MKHLAFASSQNSQSFLSSSQLETSQESAEESDVDDSQNAASSSGSQHHSRKEKSLGILCRRFLVTMGENLREGTDIHLETVAVRMDTEKRRIYDIVNVMEALEAMSKTNKSFYRWNTLAMLPQLMDSLKVGFCISFKIQKFPFRKRHVETICPSESKVSRMQCVLLQSWELNAKQ